MSPVAIRDGGLRPAEQRVLLRDFDRVLGLDLLCPPAARRADPRIAALVEQRRRARLSKDWQLADAIRDALAAEGVELEDTPEGTRTLGRSPDS